MSKDEIVDTTAYDEKRTVCASSGDMHRYFIFKTEVAYEKCGAMAIRGLMRDVFEKVEYAILGCNCGSVIKERVKSWLEN